MSNNANNTDGAIIPAEITVEIDSSSSHHGMTAEQARIMIEAGPLNRRIHQLYELLEKNPSIEEAARIRSELDELNPRLWKIQRGCTHVAGDYSGGGGIFCAFCNCMFDMT